MKKRWITFFAAASLAVLILDSKTSLYGASEGLNLCIQVIIPTLFPYFLCSNFLCNALLGRSYRLLHPINRWFGIPDGGEAIILVGLLGGYPVGAQCVSQAYRDGNLSAQKAQHMLAFCSNAGPAFIFGVGATLFPALWMRFMLWGIHIASAGCVAILTPGHQYSEQITLRSHQVSLASIMKTAIVNMVNVCGWIVVFRIILAFVQTYFIIQLPIELHCLLFGLIELSNGCIELGNIANIGARLALFSALISSGGLCVMMQTYSVCKNLDCSRYLPGKIAQCAISVAITIPVQLMLDHQKCTLSHLLLLAACSLIIIGYRVLGKMYVKNDSIFESASV